MWPTFDDVVASRRGGKWQQPEDDALPEPSATAKVTIYGRASAVTFLKKQSYLGIYNERMDKNNHVPFAKSVNAAVVDAEFIRADGAAANGVLKKQVDMLALSPQDRRISFLARKIYNIMMCHAQHAPTHQDVYRLSISDVIKSLQYDSSDTKILKDHLRQMASTTVEWQSPSSLENERWGVSALIAHADIIQMKEGCFLEWSYSKPIRERVIEPSRFAKIALKYQNAIKTHAALALYEICVRYIDNPGGLTAKQPWGWWRPVLTGEPDAKGGATGIYSEFKFFNNRVIKRATSEINAVTDILVEPLVFKRGRAVSELQFKVMRKNTQKPPGSAIHEPVDIIAVGRAIKCGIAQDKAERLLERFGDERLSRGLSELEVRISRAELKTIHNPYAFIKKIIETQDEGGLFDSPSQVVVIRPDKLMESKQVKLLETYRTAKRAEAFSLYQELPEVKRLDFRTEFEIHALPKLNSVIQNAFKKSGISGPMVRSMFVAFLAENMWGLAWNTPTDSQLLEFSLSTTI